MRKIKIAQIGAEHDHAPCIIDSLRKQSDIFEIVGYSVPEGERNIAPKEYKGLKLLSTEELLNFHGLDAVSVETSEKNLTKYALMAAKKGFAVHMDKPGGTVLSDFEQLIHTVKNNNTVFSIGYMYRYNPAVKTLMKQIKSGELGDIYSVEAQMSCAHNDAKRKWLGEYKGGMMFYLGCHLIDLILQIQGTPQEIIPLNRKTGINGIEAEDFGMAVFKYPSGISFAKTCAAEPGGYMRRQLVVCGSKGTVCLEPLEAYDESTLSSNLYTGVRNVLENQLDWHNDGDKYRTEKYDRYDKMMREFAEYVNGEKENPYSLEYELQLYKTLLKCCEIK